MENAIIIKPNDNVVTVIMAINKGDAIIYPSCEVPIRANTNIPVYHKVAIKTVKKGEKIYKYGEVIGYAIKNIAIGDHVHTHNLSSEKPE
jgi:altronate dehydratase small subunit